MDYSRAICKATPIPSNIRPNSRVFFLSADKKNFRVAALTARYDPDKRHSAETLRRNSKIAPTRTAKKYTHTHTHAHVIYVPRSRDLPARLLLVIYAFEPRRRCRPFAIKCVRRCVNIQKSAGRVGCTTK